MRKSIGINHYLNRHKLNIIYSLAAILVMWLVWVVAYYTVKNDYLIPSFPDTVVSLFVQLGRKVFWRSFCNTLLRTLLAFSVSFVIAIVLVVLGTVFRGITSFIKPFSEVARALPTLAVILILLFWTSPKIAPVVVTSLVLFPLIYSELSASVAGIDVGIKEMVKVYAISKKDSLFKIYLPQLYPDILAQSGANISLGLKVMISAEVLSNTYMSLGGLMQDARTDIDMPALAALTLVTVIIGFFIDVCFSLCERFAFKWKKRNEYV